MNDTGKFVSLHDLTVTYTETGGVTSTRSVAPTGKVTLNGKAVTLQELRTGDGLTFSGDPASTVTATR
jgi:hypothetical protein